MCTQSIKKINLISRIVGDTSWSCILAWYATLRVWHHQTLPHNNLRHLDIIYMTMIHVLYETLP